MARLFSHQWRTPHTMSLLIIAQQLQRLLAIKRTCHSLQGRRVVRLLFGETLKLTVQSNQVQINGLNSDRSTTIQDKWLQSSSVRICVCLLQHLQMELLTFTTYGLPSWWETSCNHIYSQSTVLSLPKVHFPFVLTSQGTIIHGVR